MALHWEEGIILPTKGYLMISRDFSGCHTGEGGCYCISLVESRDVAKYPVTYTTVPHSKDLSGPNVSNAKIEKFWSIQITKYQMSGICFLIKFGLNLCF